MHAAVRLAHEAHPPHAYGVVKLAFDLTGAPVQPTRLRGDPDLPDDDPRRLEVLHPGSDFIAKPCTDVAVVGSAFAPPGQAVPSMDVRCRVGSFVKRVAVFGRRLVRWGSRVTFTEPEPFVVMPMSNRHAYGGCDGRVPFRQPSSSEELIEIAAAFPGSYPRNPAGKGYVVFADAVHGELELPNLEDPDRLLTPDTLFVGDPRDWWRQRMPWTLCFRDLAMFPRLLPYGVRFAYPPPDDERLEEVRTGELPRGFHAASDVASLLGREASAGLSFDALIEGTPIVVAGMHLEGRAVAFTIPRQPALALRVEGVRQPTETRLTNVIVRPAEETIELTYRARTRDLPRTFI
ncbi:MAG TPA: DUF2169 domain-containing protein, partial [Minicystis sp.]|nr:DUF2169 domain-containing protein [Minicystis sp.]